MQVLGGLEDDLGHWSAGPLTLECLVSDIPSQSLSIPSQVIQDFSKEGFAPAPSPKRKNCCPEV